MSMKMREPASGTERAHADRCTCRDGEIRTKNGQDVVYCVQCGAFCYCAPRVETGREVRSVTTIHNGIRPKDRARVIARASGRCEMCGSRDNLHVGHLLSVDDGIKQGFTEAFLNDDENLACFCSECNLGMGCESVPLRLVVAILRARGKEPAA
jgi:hypothetical protein